MSTETLKDNYGDEIEVSTSGSGEVFLDMDDSKRVSSACAALTPKKARRLAKALKRAAKAAEAR